MVITRAAGVQLLANVTNQVDEAGFDVHVHVFPGNRPIEIAGCDFAFDLHQSLVDLGDLLGSQHALYAQHTRVSTTATDVFGEHALVKLDGSCELLHKSVGCFAETSAP